MLGWDRTRGHGLAPRVLKMTILRRAAVAGSWYPASAPALEAAVDAYLARVGPQGVDVDGDVVALVAPHAGLMYSGPVAAHAYNLLTSRQCEVAILVGPSHFVGFDGVAVCAAGAFETPFGAAEIDADIVAALLRHSSVIKVDTGPHVREHSLEMQLPFLRRVSPATKIVPLLMGYQTAATADALAIGIAEAVRGKPALLVASTDLSHYHDAKTARRLDSVVIDCVARLEPDDLQRALDRQPDHACGGGPTVAVMKAAKALGATTARILDYADSGDVSGDKSSVVGYLAAALCRPSP
jgi:AmmeMemoRadiSam system protein B